MVVVVLVVVVLVDVEVVLVLVVVVDVVVVVVDELDVLVDVVVVLVDVVVVIVVDVVEVVVLGSIQISKHTQINVSLEKFEVTLTLSTSTAVRFSGGIAQPDKSTPDTFVTFGQSGGLSKQ